MQFNSHYIVNERTKKALLDIIIGYFVVYLNQIYWDKKIKNRTIQTPTDKKESRK